MYHVTDELLPGRCLLSDDEWGNFLMYLLVPPSNEALIQLVIGSEACFAPKRLEPSSHRLSPYESHTFEMTHDQLQPVNP